MSNAKRRYRRRRRVGRVLLHIATARARRVRDGFTIMTRVGDLELWGKAARVGELRVL